MKITIHPEFQNYKDDIIDCILKFEDKGDLIYGGSRNSIKTFKIKGLNVNIKAFKKTNFIKKIIYTYFRPSKAKRSYDFGLRLLEKKILTPQPIAYILYKDRLGLTKSYYVSEHLEFDLMFKDLVDNPNFPYHKEILRQFTKFTFRLHENGIEFKDHSPGNTLIKKINKNHYNFYLVDLNRMRFHDKMSLEKRMYNLRRLTPKLDMVSVIADEYGKLSNENSEKLLKMIWENTSKFQRKFHRKKRFKKRILKS